MVGLLDAYGDWLSKAVAFMLIALAYWRGMEAGFGLGRARLGDRKAYRSFTRHWFWFLGSSAILCLLLF